MEIIIYLLKYNNLINELIDFKNYEALIQVKIMFLIKCLIQKVSFRQYSKNLS